MKDVVKKRQVIRRVAAVLHARYRPQQIILFGSYASGNAHKDSDIDLLIVKATTKPFFQRLAEVRALVTDARRGHPFEPVVVTPQELKRRLARGDQFLAQILRTGRRLYAAHS
jgi:predicted nucleotidyltransferase